MQCEKEGHLDGASALSSDFQGMTFGNIIFGGVIGVGIDAASGAMHEYPPSVTVVLPPEEFDTAESRDRFFERQKARIREESQEAISEVRKNCASSSRQSSSEERCDKAVEAIKDAREARLDALETKREAARIDSDQG